MGNSNSNPQKEKPQKKSKISRIKQNLSCFESEEHSHSKVSKSKPQLAQRQQEHYGILMVMNQGENKFFKLLNNKPIFHIIEFLVLEETINLRLTCRRLNYCIFNSLEINFNLLAYKVLNPCNAPIFLEDVSRRDIIQAFEITRKKYNTVNKLKYMENIIEMLKAYTQKMLIYSQLEKTDFKISELYKILSKPQIPVSNFNPDLEYDFSESWFQYVQHSEQQQNDLMSQQQQELHNILEDPSDLIEIRFVIIQDLILQNTLQLEDQECPILFQGVHSFLNAIHFHCTNLISLMKMIDQQNDFGLIQYYVFAWSSYQGSMFQLKQCMDPFLSNFDQIFHLYYVVPEWLQKRSFTSEQIMRRIWCINIINDKELWQRLTNSFESLHKNLLKNSVKKNNNFEKNENYENSSISLHGFKKNINTIHLFIRGIIDLCCTQDNIKWLGHSKFPIHKIIKNIFSIVEENLIRFYQDLFSEQHTAHDIMQIMQIEQEINRKLFPKWIYESIFLPLSCKIVTQQLEFMSNTENKQIEEEELLMESSEEPIKEKQCQIQGVFSTTESFIMPQSVVTNTTLSISHQFGQNSQQFSQFVLKSLEQETTTKLIIKEISTIIQKADDFTKQLDQSIENFNQMGFDEFQQSLDVEQQKILDPFQQYSTNEILPFLGQNQKQIQDFEILELIDKSTTQQTKFVHIKNNPNFKSLADLINKTSGVKK